MTLMIDIQDEQGWLTKEASDKLIHLLKFAGERLHLGAAEVSVSLVNNDEIQALNARYRNKDQPTDVLSFALEESAEDEMEILGTDLPRVLGDIIISIPKAREQAETYGHAFERELGFLAVHGLLHLLGYDHQSDEERKTMFSLQEDLLAEFGLKRDKG
ncbi:rRNA maturation RNase YbeY [Camelliibacillus cellulosilyticus]|uniref:Endoribonuclease YbeY n=1 Tax=Camelliibacillus cellulosilyticus TaxID=2174486 RepID=A0ABV9GLC9_9BACL